ncbi:hypothetical protein HY486_03700 [Candidatus Woesearchaeota archaeon]|nr:hypothetical protein [Candidatus Woesearchaeota archaeon]
MNIEEIFQKVKSAFPEINSRIIVYGKRSFMSSSPLTGNIYYNQKDIEQKRFSIEALKGALAHELAHQIAYKKIGLVGRLFFKLRYRLSKKYKRESEIIADEVAVKRGFGKNLIQLTTEYQKKFGRRRFDERIKPFHLTVYEIRAMMQKKAKPVRLTQTLL